MCAPIATHQLVISRTVRSLQGLRAPEIPLFGLAVQQTRKQLWLHVNGRGAASVFGAATQNFLAQTCRVWAFHFSQGQEGEKKLLSLAIPAGNLSQRNSDNYRTTYSYSGKKPENLRGHTGPLILVRDKANEVRLTSFCPTGGSAEGCPQSSTHARNVKVCGFSGTALNTG